MKCLYQFENFDMDRFLSGKELTVTACGPWLDYDTKAQLGTKIETVITRDKTPYTPGKNGIATNLYEKMTVKVAKEVSVPISSQIELINATANVYGDYRNQLSVKAEDVKVIGSAAQQGSGKNG